MLTADKYIDKLQKIGFDEKQAKQVADKMITFAYFVVDTYWNAKNASKAENPSANVAQPEQILEKVATIQTK
jgi:hypothetical protein